MAPKRAVNNSRSVQNRAKKINSKKFDESLKESPPEDEAIELTLEDAQCPICQSLMIQPVTLPCKHSLCLSCYTDTVDKSNLNCPVCRERIAVFCRKAAKNKNAVNEKLWAKIQETFPVQVNLKLEGNEEDMNDSNCFIPDRKIAEPGDLQKEFEEQQEVLRLQEEERRKKEEKASAAVLEEFERQEEERRHNMEERRRNEEKATAAILAEIEREQAEELARSAELERIRIADEAYALELSKQHDILTSSPSMSTPLSTRKRPRKTSSDPKSTPTAKKINKFFSSRSISNENDDEPAGSSSAFASVTEHLPKIENSITQGRSSSGTSSESVEFEAAKRINFRPINAAPLTPPKQAPNNGEILKPQVVSGTIARNLNNCYQFENDEVVDVNHNNEDAKGEGELAEVLKQMERDFMQRKREQEEADRELARQLHDELNSEHRLVVNRSKGSQNEYQLRAKSKKQSTLEDSFYRGSQTGRNSPLP